jgi:hypothetical protein
MTPRVLILPLLKGVVREPLWLEARFPRMHLLGNTVNKLRRQVRLVSVEGIMQEKL